MLPFFRWMEGVGVYSAHHLIGPIVNIIHLLCMVVFAGALLVVDLRLLGFALRRQPLKQIARDAQPWLIGGFLGLLITGIPAVMTVATELYGNGVFWFKMELILVAVIFTFTLRRKVALADEARVKPVWGKLVGAVSIVLWGVVAASARLIMFL